MRARHLVLAAAIAAPLACSSSPTPSGPAVSIVPTVVVPQDLIGEITSFTVEILSTTGGIGCNTAMGTVTGNVSGATVLGQPTSVIDTNTASSMGQPKCVNGTTRCAYFAGVAYQTVPSVFSVVGYAPDGKTEVATGCAEAMIDSATVDVNIKLVRVIAKATCKNGMVEVGETCDEPSNTTPSCDETTCETVEQLFSYGDKSQAGTSTGAAGQKSEPFLLWGSGSGGESDSAGVFMAVFTDTSTGTNQITARFLDDTMGPTSLFGPVVGESSIFVPDSTTTFPPGASTNDQKDPSAATIGTTDYVVFSSDAPVTKSDAFDIYYRSFKQSNLTALQSNPCAVSKPLGMATYTATKPSAAANGGALYVAWQNSDGNVQGQFVRPGTGCGTLGTQGLFGAGTAPKVASAGTGWVVVWESSGSIKLRLLDSTGTAIGATKTVGTGSNPSVASAPPNPSTDFAVAWAGSSTSIRVQRYTSAGNPLQASDAMATINSATTDAVQTPAIAAGTLPTSGAFYVVAWVDTHTAGGAVRARLVSAVNGLLTDETGYLFNTIDGQTDDFQVSVTPDRNPANPAVVIGGAGYMAFAWEDHGATCPTSPGPGTFPGTPCWGIVGRRFPLPTQ